ncbi:MAG TPA: hypothetical protein VMT62_12840 [Syntrophorhabdaceae bacterium]|nr:hypothetical protein [Syntrophorhabdaceae bacterium]
MKKALVGFMVLALCFGFVGVVMAQGDAGLQDIKQQFMTRLDAARSMDFEGTVLSHDVMCHCIVLATNMGNLTLQDDYARFDQEYNRAKGLVIGSKVRGTYKTVDFINYAINISYAK